MNKTNPDRQGHYLDRECNVTLDTVILDLILKGLAFNTSMSPNSARCTCCFLTHPNVSVMAA